MAIETAPNQTLYIRNLNDTVSKQDLKLTLYTFFVTHGSILDIVALKTPKMRGQAHVVFRDVVSANKAMQAGQGVLLLGKAMQIAYARGVSDYIKKLEGTFQMPVPDRSMGDAESDEEAEAAPRGQKRSRDAEEEMDDERVKK